MTSSAKELRDFLKEYERRTNAHDFKLVRPLIASNATYWFSDGEHKGIRAIENAFERTWDVIREETYAIRHVRWLFVSSKVAACTYTFLWKGKVQGKKRAGRGHGTSILIKGSEGWQVQHEHLSTS